MKIKFEENLDYQLEAVSSITDIFAGQQTNKTLFTVERESSQLKIGEESDELLGTGNKLSLFPEEVLENLNKIQTRNAVAKTEILDRNDYNFSVEMETGTGKTYVYLRTIMELNKKYEFTKFIIVVPSIAIKEGVYKTLEITKEHFKSLYNNVPYDYFIYDSKKIDMIRNFAVNDAIQIMIIAIDAINKDTNVINQERDQANGYRPIDYIKQCNPIVIVDEPQNMETDKAKNAIKELNPLCTLRYSATHKNKYNPVFKLNSVDAYEKKLVKQIEVATIEASQNANTEYIKVTDIKVSKGKSPTAKIEIDEKTKKGVVRKEIKVALNDDLKEKSKRDIYEGYVIREITYNEEEPSKSFVDFGRAVLTLGQINGGENPDVIKRMQIRKTIQEHFEKQIALKNKGIKVLSLFFIDKVANYRIHNKETGEVEKGKYALMFEEEYNRLLELPKYAEMGDVSVSIEERAALAHDGYFSADKKKKKSKTGKEYFEEKDTKGNTEVDNDTFNKIMKDKERLLSFDEPLSFIFSHSALKEGWDNPNVFQICTLNETTSEMKKRQEIGRGLRIAVNQNGERVRGFDVNTLTVMANESYEQFVSSLQKEMEQEEDIKFGIIENYIFTNIIDPENINSENETEKYFGHEKSKELYDFLVEEGYVANGKITDKLKKDLDNGELKLSEKFEYVRTEIEKKLKLSTRGFEVKNQKDRQKISINKEVFLNDDFKKLWDKVKYKTTYQVDFDSEKLKKECIKNIDDELYIPNDKILYIKELIEINRGGIRGRDSSLLHEDIYIENRFKLPDIVSYLQNETNLTRKSIVEILTNTKTFPDSFKKDPQLYLDQVSDIIKRTMGKFLVDGIKYEKIGDTEFYSQEIFEESELFGYLKTEMSKGNIVESTKSPYTKVVYDSDIEKNFSQGLEKSENVIVYAKLPDWFKVQTPLGTYNPDWAVLVKPDLYKDEEKLYFIAETKGALNKEDRKEKENLKINCGRKHFKAISEEIKFKVTDSFEHFSKEF